jgi:hypothetical protein
MPLGATKLGGGEEGSDNLSLAMWRPVFASAHFCKESAKMAHKHLRKIHASCYRYGAANTLKYRDRRKRTQKDRSVYTVRQRGTKYKKKKKGQGLIKKKAETRSDSEKHRNDQRSETRIYYKCIEKIRQMQDKKRKKQHERSMHCT